MSDDGQGSGSGEDERSVIRCRGLPWSTTVDEIMEFFSDCQFANGAESIHMTMTREGRPSGEAYMEMATEEDVEKALKKDRKNMGKRYVEVFKAKLSEMEWVIKRAGNSAAGGGAEPNGDNVVRLRGLPFEATKQDIVGFFDGLEITNNGILLTTDYQGRASGEAFVQFSSAEHTEKALEKNKQSMGHRPVDKITAWVIDLILTNLKREGHWAHWSGTLLLHVNFQAGTCLGPGWAAKLIKYIEVFRSSMMDAQKSQMMGGPRGGGAGGRGGGYGGGMMRGGGGRPGPYDRMGGPRGGPSGRGYGNYGPGAGGGMGSRNFKSFGGNDNYYGGNEGGYGGGGGRFGGPGGMGGGPGRFVVHMRGLPFRVTENDIAEWFSSVVDPIDISIRYNNQGRPTGEADILFSSDADARKAMTKDRQNMQHRYVELFYEGGPGGMAGGGRGGGMGGGRGGGQGFGGGAPVGGPRGGYGGGAGGFSSAMSGGGGGYGGY